MSTFTMKLKEVIKLTGGTLTIGEDGISRLEDGNIGLQYYTLDFDPSNPDYKDRLNGLIIDHYYNQEIGMETIDMFQLAMRRKMNEIMPYYNTIYKSTLVEYGALSTVDLHTISSTDATQNAVNTGATISTNDSNSESRAVNSSTPQTMLSGNSDYADSAADANSTSHAGGTSEENSESNSTNAANGDTRITGYQGAASDLMMRFRESIINVDVMVINELEELFMLVWNNGDAYSKRRYGYYS